jgi:sigma-B regulation protein RsbU (phosphoserine phosphatase)
VREWVLVIAPAGVQVDPIALRMAIANLNLLSRGMAQYRLNARVRALKERLEHGLEEVARIQRSLLPEVPALPGYDLAVHYRPAAIAGGDYYDFRLFDDGRVGIVVADVAGHGPGAAVVMAMLRTIMSAYRLGNVPPAEVVTFANRLLADGLAPGAFVTTVFISLNLETGAGLYFNCGHCLPRIYRRDGAIERLTGGGSPPLGIVPDLDATAARFELGPGERLLLFTDGISEAPSADGTERFGDDRLEAILGPAAAPAAALGALAEALDRYSGATPRRDDECALLLQRRGGEDECEA